MEPTTLEYDHQQLLFDGVNLNEIAQQFGTPLYVYSRLALENAYREYAAALSDLPHMICFAVKANGNLAILNILAQLGAGFDIVSQGELARVLAAGGNPKKVVFSGVGKQEEEIRYALEQGILCFNLESEAELDLLAKIAQQKKQPARIAIRINPDVDAGTHPYISTGLRENKFGLDFETAKALFLRAQAMPFIEIRGVACHIGSQITEMSPFLETVDQLLDFVDAVDRVGVTVKHLDIGGGLGVTYKNETPPTPQHYLGTVRKQVEGRNLKLLVEPGRSLVAHAGIFLTKILNIKAASEKNFAIVDGAMNDLLRPALYGAWHPILPVTQRDGSMKVYDIVGPICETTDFLGKDRSLNVEPDDLLAVQASGAYGFVLSSNYNARGRAAEVVVSNGQPYLVRKRETIQDLWRGEAVLPET